MFKTRKQLKDEIRRLETELYEEKSKTRVSAFIESAGLPQCKSLACADCSHVVYRRSICGDYYIVGCGKNNPCSDYEKDLTVSWSVANQAMKQPRWQL